jgi:hypothetical protein
MIPTLISHNSTFLTTAPQQADVAGNILLFFLQKEKKTKQKK